MEVKLSREPAAICAACDREADPAVKITLAREGDERVLCMTCACALEFQIERARRELRP